MFQIEQALAGESLRALQSFAQGLPQAQCNVLMALINGLARDLVQVPPPAKAQTPSAEPEAQAAS